MTVSASSVRRIVAGIAAAAVLTLTACSTPTDSASPSPSPSLSPSASASPSASPSPQVSITPAADLSAIKVEGDTPKVTVPAPWGISSTQTKVLRKGGAQMVAEGASITVNYVGVNGRTGSVFDSSFERGTPATFSLDDGVIAGFSKGLTGQAVGSRVLIGMTSSDGYPTGQSSAGIEAGDSLLFVVDILSASFTEAEGEAVAPKAGLPTVKIVDNKPELTIGKDAVAPTELVVQPLIKGAGAKVEDASTIQVKYRSWTFGDGKLINDEWRVQSGELSTMIQGWKDGLVGQTAGSRVMLIVPPAMAYPDGMPSATPTLGAGETLVYVIDVLDVQS